MLILAELLRDGIEWRSAQIHLKLVVSDEQAAATANANLNDLAQNLRIDAVVNVLIAQGRSSGEILLQSFCQADMVIMGLADCFSPAAA
jgi:solute carrier family 12 sodium/potassium/chloride transporter 2